MDEFKLAIPDVGSHPTILTIAWGALFPFKASLNGTRTFLEWLLLNKG